MKLILPLLLISIFPLVLCAQHTTPERHDVHEKERAIYEVITSGIYVYSLEHDEGVFANELHVTYWFNHTYGAGVSYTIKYEADETLHDLALIGSMNPAKWITLNVGASFALPSEHRDFYVGAYTEAEINIRPTTRFHFGPVIGAVFSEESEGAIGFHLGFEF